LRGRGWISQSIRAGQSRSYQDLFRIFEKTKRVKIMKKAHKKVRWGILGAARILRRAIPALQASHNVELRAIASRDPEKGHEFADHWGIPLVHNNYESLLADFEIDAVYIPLPNSLHAEWVIKAAEAGKHVLCEKPLALTPQEVEAIEAAAQTHQVHVMEGFMYRFHPQQARVRQLLAAGEIGQPRVLRGTFAFTINAADYNIRLDNKLGGGATWDVGCYAINVARWLFGSEPHTVYAEATLVNGLDLSAAVILDFGSEQRAVLDYGMNYGRRSSYELLGTKGSLSIENMWQEPDAPAFLYIRTNNNSLEIEEFPPINHFQLEIEAFNQAVLSGQPVPYALKDSALNARVCVAVLQAIRENRKIKL
jgi:D-xylose 1-dehydrogenase (NADP+, D-xylono-1,5-lactone-forming)